MTELDELLPCPFCGGEPEMISGGPGNHYVTCLVCGASSVDGTIERAVAAWNRRARPSPVAEPVAWRTDIFESLPNGKLTRLILEASEVKNPDPDWKPLYYAAPHNQETSTGESLTYEDGLQHAASEAYRVCAQTRHMTLASKCVEAIRALRPASPTQAS